MDKLSPDSKEFIDYVRGKLKNPLAVDFLQEEIVRKIEYFVKELFGESQGLLLETIREKQVKGSIEHGGVENIPEENIGLEVKGEIIDLFVWELMYQFKVEKGKKN